MNSKEEAIKKLITDVFYLSRETKHGFSVYESPLDLINDVDYEIKSLCESESNWIKIESENDLPKTYGQYWVIRKDGEIDILSYDNYSGFCHDIFEDIECTHYHPIQKPNPPIF